MNRLPKEILEIFDKILELDKIKDTDNTASITSLINRLKTEIIDLRKKDARLISQSLEATMEQMVGFMAHQWKQPLNAVNIIVQNLEDAYNFDELDQKQIYSATQDVMDQVNFMSHSIDDFRNIYIQGKEKKKISIDDTLNRAAELVKRSFSSLNIEIKLVLQADCQVCGYVNELFQVILNILSNIKTTFMNSVIPNNKRFVEIFSSRINNNCQIVISDNTGTPAGNYLEKIFGSDEPVQETALSVGSGLLMSKFIVTDKFGGTISARNTDQGTIFTITIPISTEDCC